MRDPAMRLIFLYGPVASGKLTVGRELSRRMALPLFHNHLVVDAVMAVFPFGSPEFVRLRETLWLDVIGTAADAGRSLIFTFAPEGTVEPGFADRVRRRVEQAGGQVVFVRLDVDDVEQERRLTDPSREAFGKLRDLDLLRDLREGFRACLEAMPTPDLAIDTGSLSAPEAARLIADREAGAWRRP